MTEKSIRPTIALPVLVAAPLMQVVSVEDPPVREAGQIVTDVDELVGKLKEKGFSS